MFYAIMFAAGYVAAVFTWDRARTFVTGAESEVARLKAKAADLTAKIKAVV